MAKSKGLGDTIDKITTATGIKKVVNKVTGGGCGCGKRKAALNKAFPYKNNGTNPGNKKQSTGKTSNKIINKNRFVGSKVIKK